MKSNILVLILLPWVGLNLNYVELNENNCHSSGGNVFYTNIVTFPLEIN